MITIDQYSKDLSSDFNTAIAAKAQKIKPKVVVTWLDSRHLDNLVVTTNSSHANTSYPETGFYFSASEAFNGIERQSFTWGVAGAKDRDGDVIKADGTWHTMPSLITTDLANTQVGGNLEFGWWSASQSNASVHGTYSGYGFVTDPYIEATFTSRKVNKIRIITSEYYGRIANYTIYVYDSSNNLVVSFSDLIPASTYYKDHILSAALSTQNIAKIRVTVHSTRNPSDNARIQEVIPLYEEDMSDYVISMSLNRTRDIHETSLPIGGSEMGTASVEFDNTTKKFNIFDNSSQYGKYLKKELKVDIYSGWRIKKPSDDYIDNIYLDTFLTANANSTTTSLSVNDTSIFPSGGAGNHFVVILDKDTQSEELILCSGVTLPSTLNVVQRGYAGTTAKSHTTQSSVKFEVYEYVKNGTYYIDEWNTTSSSMTVGASMQDWTKYLVEKTIKYGFLLQNAYVGDAVKNLLMRSNFPRADIEKLSKYSQGAIERGAIASYSFKEETIDRSGNNIIPSNGLRARFWGMPSNKKDISVKDILADALDRQLTKMDLALGETRFVSPSYVALSKSISSNSSNAIQLVDYSFTGANGTSYSDYYNGVIDGYYIPLASGNQNLVIYITGGGVRLYLDDALIINKWNTYESNTRLQSTTVNLTAGVPRKIRLEFYHPYNNGPTSNFRLALYKVVGAGVDTLVTANECTTIAAFDSIGTKNASSNLTVADAYNMRNNGIYINNPKLSQPTGLISETQDGAVLLESNAYIRIPMHDSINISNANSSLYTGKWTIEFYGKFNTGSFSSNGEYISTWANGTPTSGFEFFNNSSSNGFKIRTLSNSVVITETVSSNTALSSNSFNHIVATFDGTKLYYYVNGDLKSNTTIVGSQIAFASDITIGGRGASFTANVGEVAPSTIRTFTIDEFQIYNQTLTPTQIKDRYSESQIQPLTNFAFLYGNNSSLKQIIDDITFADIGRLYIDELGKAKYEHFYRFFETSIDQHANVQSTISDSTYLIDGSYTVQLQCNKVDVPLSGLQKAIDAKQALWNIDNDTTITAVTLSSNMTANSNVAYYSSNSDIPFPNAGYIKIGSEIIKYNSKTGNSFNNLERGQFQTAAASHIINDGNGSKIREVKYFNVSFQKAPAFNVQTPFITAIRIDEPDLLEIHKYIPYAYGAELIIAAANTAPVEKIIMLAGEDRETRYPYATSIAGIPVEISEQNSDIKSQTASVAESIKKYGIKDVTIQSNFINDAIHAQRIADFIISKTQIPVAILNVTTVIMPKVQLGDRIRISNFTALGITNTDYWVISYSRTIGSNFTQQMTLRQVS
jgi:hypothetical protein